MCAGRKVPLQDTANSTTKQSTDPESARPEANAERLKFRRTGMYTVRTV